MTKQSLSQEEINLYGAWAKAAEEFISHKNEVPVGAVLKFADATRLLCYKFLAQNLDPDLCLENSADLDNVSPQLSVLYDAVEVLKKYGTSLDTDNFLEEAFLTQPDVEPDPYYPTETVNPIGFHAYSLYRLAGNLVTRLWEAGYFTPEDAVLKQGGTPKFGNHNARTDVIGNSFPNLDAANAMRESIFHNLMKRRQALGITP